MTPVSTESRSMKVFTDFVEFGNIKEELFGFQINCYEKTGYFELRKFQTWNLNMFKILEDKNLISLYIYP